MGIIMYKDIAYGGGSSVTEGYYKVADGKFYEHFDGTTYSDEITGEDEILYLDLSTNNLYRWSTGASLFVLVGKSTLASLNDTNIATPTDGQALEYNGTSSKWVNVAKKAADTPTFTEASTRANLSGSGETMATILGKIKKWFADLAAHATVPLDDETVKIGTYDDDSAVFSTCTKATYNDGVLTLASKVNFNETIAQNVFIPEVDIAEKSDTDPYIYRPSVANGDRVSEDIVGASVGWNQYVKNPDFSTTSNWTERRTGTLTISGGEATLTATNSTYNNQIYQNFSGVANHVYLLAISAKKVSGSFTKCLLGLFNNIDPSTYTAFDLTTSYGYYFAILKPSFSPDNIRFGIRDGVASGDIMKVNGLWSTDLTLDFGATIADYIYSLEQATAGAGVAFFRKYFPNAYYPYNAGELLSVEVEGKKYVGKNLVDFSQFASLYPSYCSFADGVLSILSVNSVLFNTGIPVSVPQSALYLSCKLKSGTATNIRIRAGYDDGTSADITSSITPSTWTEAKGAIDTTKKLTSIRFNWSTGGTFEVKDFQLELGNTATTYEPYKEYTYTFPSQTLRGLFTLVDGKLKAVGDVYDDSGVVTRKYGVVDLGTLNWNVSNTNGFYVPLPESKTGLSNLVCSKYPYDNTVNFAWANFNTYADKTIYKNTASTSYLYVKDTSYSDKTTFTNAMSGVYLVYEKATPTTEQAEPLVMPQICDKNGTEEFITDGIVPVGHESTYYNYPYYMEEGEYKDFRDRVDYAPELAKWHKVGIYANGDTITIDGYYNEIMLVPNHYSGTTLLACASPAIFPFSLFKSITLQNSTESERIDITPAGVVGVTGTYFSNVAIYVR